MTADLLKSAAPPSEDWPELVPLNAPDLPRLDPAHLPGWAGDFTQAVAADTETPPELAVGMVLVACATAAARRLRVMVKPGYFEPCNLWAVVALPPGTRKSAVQSAATAPLRAWEHEQAKNMEPEIKRIASKRKTMEASAKEKRSKAARERDNGEAEELAREAADIEAKLPDIPILPQLWTSDATPERLGTLLAEHGECMAWLSSEGGVFELLQGRYSKGIPNLDLVLKAHSGDAERVDRGSRPPVIPEKPAPEYRPESPAGCIARAGCQAWIPWPWTVGAVSLSAAAVPARLPSPSVQPRSGGSTRRLRGRSPRHAGVGGARHRRTRR